MMGVWKVRLPPRKRENFGVRTNPCLWALLDCFMFSAELCDTDSPWALKVVLLGPQTDCVASSRVPVCLFWVTYVFG